MTDKSERRKRFENVAGKRVQALLDKLDSLSNCSNKNNYEYTDVDVRKMFLAIRERVKIAEASFHDQLNKKSKNIFKF
ncbi:MAG: hypothetical protein H0W62_09885 [Chitinophagales bacterium]|jgi:hypothetical protein|nr:hypothetical protein [Chitinophagales bacterium]